MLITVHHSLQVRFRVRHVTRTTEPDDLPVTGVAGTCWLLVSIIQLAVLVLPARMQDMRRRCPTESDRSSDESRRRQHTAV
jgi:hypothetical protein